MINKLAGGPPFLHILAETTNAGSFQSFLTVSLVALFSCPGLVVLDMCLDTTGTI